ncbi:MAG TPA: hypothetical protein VJ044_03340, partial [Candidatus Hodarchaeales archaeon]|nr:hypothetical protein [Candidatus Hodarchaeales archaeon]
FSIFCWELVTHPGHRFARVDANQSSGIFQGILRLHSTLGETRVSLLNLACPTIETETIFDL